MKNLVGDFWSNMETVFWAGKHIGYWFTLNHFLKKGGYDKHNEIAGLLVIANIIIDSIFFKTSSNLKNWFTITPPSENGNMLTQEQELQGVNQQLVTISKDLVVLKGAVLSTLLENNKTISMSDAYIINVLLYLEFGEPATRCWTDPDKLVEFIKQNYIVPDVIVIDRINQFNFTYSSRYVKIKVLHNFEVKGVCGKVVKFLKGNTYKIDVKFLLYLKIVVKAPIEPKLINRQDDDHNIILNYFDNRPDDDDDQPPIRKSLGMESNNLSVEVVQEEDKSCNQNNSNDKGKQENQGKQNNQSSQDNLNINLQQDENLENNKEENHQLQDDSSSNDIVVEEESDEIQIRKEVEEENKKLQEQYRIEQENKKVQENRIQLLKKNKVIVANEGRKFKFNDNIFSNFSSLTNFQIALPAVPQNQIVPLSPISVPSNNRVVLHTNTDRNQITNNLFQNLRSFVVNNQRKSILSNPVTPPIITTTASALAYAGAKALKTIAKNSVQVVAKSLASRRFFDNFELRLVKLDPEIVINDSQDNYQLYRIGLYGASFFLGAGTVGIIAHYFWNRFYAEDLDPTFAQQLQVLEVMNIMIPPVLEGNKLYYHINSGGEFVKCGVVVNSNSIEFIKLLILHWKYGGKKHFSELKAEGNKYLKFHDEDFDHDPSFNSSMKSLQYMVLNEEKNLLLNNKQEYIKELGKDVELKNKDFFKDVEDIFVKILDFVEN